MAPDVAGVPAPYIEPSSGFVFPRSIECPPGVPQHLLGAGIRTIFLVSTYAVGLYIEDEPLFALPDFHELEKLPNASRDIVAQQLVFDRIASTQYKGNRTLRLITTRNTTGAHTRDGLVASLTKRFPKTGVDPTVASERDRALEEFKAIFPKQLQRGTALDFTWTKDGEILVCVDGALIGRCKSDALGSALFNAYLDHDSKANAAKTEWGKGLLLLRKTPNPSPHTILQAIH